VNHLWKIIDAYQERLYSSIGYLTARGDFELPRIDTNKLQQEIKKASPRKKKDLTYKLYQHELDVLWWFGHRSDIRHAGLSRFFEDNVEQPELFTNALLDVMKREYYTAPSVCQAWGEQGERAKKMRQFIKEYKEMYVS
jgi:hypothetical protein